MNDLRQKIQTVIDTEPVALFMKGTPQFVMCGNSDRALRALRAAGAPVTAVDILPDPSIRQELSSLSGWPTIPQVFVKGELIGGADIVEELAASGELEQKLEGALGSERRPVVIDDVDHSYVLNPILRERGVKSLLGAPLLAGSRVLGVIHVVTLAHRRFGQSDIELLQVVAQRVALAVDRALAHDRI